MLAMQYGFNIDRDAVRGVRSLILEFGPTFNDLAGLAYKALLLSPPTENEPARFTPFYLWSEVDGITDFLRSAAFKGVIASFGRPPVSLGLPMATAFADLWLQHPPTVAFQHVVDVAADASLDEVVAHERFLLHELAAHPKFVCGVVTLDESNWRLQRTSFWLTAPDREVPGRQFEVPYFVFPTPGH